MAAPGIRIDVWDVGQGDCSVLTLPDGSLFVIDVGPRDSPFVPWIASRPHLRIACVALTHNDADHCGALTPLLAVTTGRLRKIRALVEPQRTQKQVVTLFRRAFEMHNSGLLDFGRLEAPAELWDDPAEGTTLDVAFPEMPEIETAPSANASSAVIRLRSRSQTLAVWPGDNHLKTVADKIAGQNPHFMVGPHHGHPQDLKKAGAAAQMDRIAPQQVLLSLGTDNSYNHPSPRYVKIAVSRQSRVTCTQLTRQCDRHRAPQRRPILDGSSLLGLLPNPKGTPCRGAIRFTLSDGELIPDEWQAEHDKRVERLQRAMCQPSTKDI